MRINLLPVGLTFMLVHDSAPIFRPILIKFVFSVLAGFLLSELIGNLRLFHAPLRVIHTLHDVVRCRP